MELVATAYREWSCAALRCGYMDVADNDDNDLWHKERNFSQGWQIWYVSIEMFENVEHFWKQIKNDEKLLKVPQWLSTDKIRIIIIYVHTLATKILSGYSSAK